MFNEHWSMDDLYIDVMNRLRESGERVGNTIELMNETNTLMSSDAIMITEKNRKFKPDYAIAEYLWYVGMDRRVGHFGEMAKIWDDIKDSNGEVESNYGSYIFEPDMWRKTHIELIKFPETRRAVIPILDKEHIGKNKKDYPCTGYVQFYIRDNMLHLTWSMRSQDVIFGMANDFFAASMILQTMLNELNHRGMNIILGYTTFAVTSLHIYERHFDLLNKAFLPDREAPQFGLNEDVTLPEIERRWAISPEMNKTEIQWRVNAFKEEATWSA